MSSVIVVEGVHDENRIKSIYPELEVITTNGREISKDTLELIQKASKYNQIIIFTDPDAPGEKIRELISNVVPNAAHAFLRKKDAISKNKKKVGIEHATKEAIIESLAHVYYPQSKQNTIRQVDLYELKLSGFAYSRKLRDRVSSHLNIGKPNAKTFLNRLNLIQIEKKELKQLCQELERQDLLISH